MKKTLLAATLFAAFGAAGSALAQSNVTIYGIVDAGISRFDNGDETTIGLQSGGQSGSRIGFRGTEDLGGGLSAIFQLENGFNVDNGTQGQGALFGRQAWVGLSSGFGAVKLGRQYNPIRSAVEGIDPFGIGLAGSAQNLFETYDERTNNSATFTTANYGGFVGQVMYGFGEVAGENKAGRTIGASGTYNNGPIRAVLAYHKIDRGTSLTPDAGDTDTVFLGGSYDFGVAKLHAAFARNKGENAAGATDIDSKDGMIGVSAPIGTGTLMASYLVRNNDFDDADTREWAIGYTYPLSKRTNFYTSYAKIKNDGLGDVTFGSNGLAATGADPSFFNVGIRHQF